ncbi:uncharacterized protein TNCV_4251161 [Trichonephila clavipes]|nr:uncharacterized protein TNCV_4251161 [Trichonephila clavipes]
MNETPATNTERAGRRSDPETSWRRSGTYEGRTKKESIAKRDHGGVGEVTVRTDSVSICNRAFGVVDGLRQNQNIQWCTLTCKLQRDQLHLAKNRPLQKPPEHVTLDEESSDSDRSKDEEEKVSDDTTYEPSCSSEPHLLTQEDLDDLIRDLKLSKKQSEMLGSRLKGWNLLQANRNICTYRSHHSQRKDFSCEKNGLVFRNDISSLMETFGIEHNPIEWRLFIDFSKASLKVVLLYNVNKFPSIPATHSASMKET